MALNSVRRTGGVRRQRLQAGDDRANIALQTVCEAIDDLVLGADTGNTAVGLALVGRAKGYAVELVMPESVTEDRRRMCAAYGAHPCVHRRLLRLGRSPCCACARWWSEQPEKYFYADQYRNPANPLAHYRTTGPEIWEQTGGAITHFVAGLGTTGTVVGTGRYLHERNPRVRVVAVEPDEPLHGLEGMKYILPSAIVPAIWDETVARRAPHRLHRGRARRLRRGPPLRRLAGRPFRRRGSPGRARRGAVAQPPAWWWSCFPTGGERYLADGR